MARQGGGDCGMSVHGAKASDAPRRPSVFSRYFLILEVILVGSIWQIWELVLELRQFQSANEHIVFSKRMLAFLGGPFLCGGRISTIVAWVRKFRKPNTLEMGIYKYSILMFVTVFVV
jgi:hypothetical protein